MSATRGEGSSAGGESHRTGHTWWRIGVFAAMLGAVAIASTRPPGTPSSLTGGDRSASAELLDSAADHAAAVARLRALGYVEAVLEDPKGEQSGVLHDDRAKSHPGVNVFCSVGTLQARFMGMAGEVLHTLPLPAGGFGKDCLVKPYAEDRFLALTEPYLSMLGADGRVLWRSKRGHHHDFAIAGSGEIFALSQADALVPHRGRELRVQRDLVTVLSADGTLAREIDLLPLFAGQIPAQRLDEIAMLAEKNRASARRVRAGDVTHTNSIEILARAFADARPGHLLICVRELDMIAVIDPARPAVVWQWGPGILDRPHHPSVLPNGNILVFDNGTSRGFSRVLEVDPIAERIVWEYRAEPPSQFFSPVRGSAQALPNGNVLITESTKGHVMEVTRANEVVWDFWNDDRRREKRRQIYRFHRFEPQQVRAAVARQGVDGEGP